MAIVGKQVEVSKRAHSLGTGLKVEPSWVIVILGKMSMCYVLLVLLFIGFRPKGTN